MKNFAVALFVAFFIFGCTPKCPPQLDQLQLDVPAELMIPPTPLKTIIEESEITPPD